MSERRRFFPATPVQRVPGRTVELEMQLRPAAPAAAQAAPAAPPPAPGVCDVMGARWLMSLTAVGADASQEELASGDWLRYGESPGINGASTWSGQPEVADQFGQWLESETYRCVHLQITIFSTTPVIVGVLQGASMSDVHWVLSWSHPRPNDPQRSLNGHHARWAGNMVWVTTLPWPDGSNAEREVLTATAFCGGAQVDQLVLELDMPQ